MKYWFEYAAQARQRFSDEAPDHDDLEELVDAIALDMTRFLDRLQDVVSFVSANPETLGWMAPKTVYYGATEYLQAAVGRHLKMELRDLVVDLEVERAGDIFSVVRSGVEFLAELHGGHPNLVEDFDRADFAWYQQLDDGIVSVGTAEGVSDAAECFRALEKNSDAVLLRAIGIGREEFVEAHIEPFERVANLAERHPDRFVKEMLRAVPSSRYVSER